MCIRDRYVPMRAWHEPSSTVSLNPLMVKQLHRWLERITTAPGSSVAQLLQRSTGLASKVQRPLAVRLLHLSSDAAKEGTDEPGLGGWFCGYWWAYRLEPRHLAIHITILEAIAAIVNVVVAVSYIHLTLPTLHSVCISLDCLQLKEKHRVDLA
eukprot:TRINITY_DN29713_c0_g1_i1.p1 TRINITY_DN29713_c0_g1~~TRINITY_DN29713_c0_g1_i1.p1  ORF type:complete len:154 (+),score=26.73 TRINITY_DN29713_c0_g1_i1:115-576(+)